MELTFRSILYTLVAAASLPACHQAASSTTNTPAYDSATTARMAITSARGAAISTFILPGYTLLDTASGDLNEDSIPDEILVLKKDGEDSTSDVVDHPKNTPFFSSPAHLAEAIHSPRAPIMLSTV